MELILHIGAHRTGTTAMQEMLTANHAALETAGVTALTHSELDRRVPGFSQVVRREQWQDARGAFAVATAGARKVVVSEENMIGDMGWNIRSGSFYWRARQRLTAYRDFFKAAPTRIGIGIRSYESYWISAHAKELTYRNMTRDGVTRFAEARDGMAGAERGWLDLVADTRAVFPESEILIWPFEARVPVERLAAGLIDTPLNLTPPAAGVNAAPDPGFIPVMEDKRAAQPGMKRKAMREWLATQTARAFEGFAPDQSARMGTRYAEDLAALNSGVGGVVMVAQPAAIPGGG